MELPVFHWTYTTGKSGYRRVILLMIAIMHGSSFCGDSERALRELAAMFTATLGGAEQMNEMEITP